jgi:hypothetical protein
MSFEVEFKAFVITIRQYLEDFNDSRLNPFLEDWPAASSKLRLVSPKHLPVLSYLPATLKAAHTNSKQIIQMLVSISSKLAWGQTYTPDDFGSAFLQRYGWTELIGQRGPVPSNHIACGFLLLGPWIEYPRHSHEAQEVYVPLTHHTAWQRKKQAWVSGAAGKPRLHASWEPHAIRTADHPLLALFLWRGDKLVQKSRIERG